MRRKEGYLFIFFFQFCVFQCTLSNEKNLVKKPGYPAKYFVLRLKLNTRYTFLYQFYIGFIYLILVWKMFQSKILGTESICVLVYADLSIWLNSTQLAVILTIYITCRSP